MSMIQRLLQSVVCIAYIQKNTCAHVCPNGIYCDLFFVYNWHVCMRAQVPLRAVSYTVTVTEYSERDSCTNTW